MKKYISTILLGTILSAGLMSACARNPDPATVLIPTDHGSEVTVNTGQIVELHLVPNPATALTLADHGREVTVSKGQILELQLVSNPSTGYTWQVSELDTELLDWSGEVEFTPQSDLIGAGGVEVFRFKARNTGQSQLSLIYHRSWEEGVEPEAVFTITVIVE